jgi:hypothetical protein
MRVHDEITEEFIQSYILWNTYFRIAEVDRWEFTTRSQRSSLPTLQCRLLMDQITINKSNPKCHLYWCLIEFIDWRHRQSRWYFRPLL